MRKRRSRKQVAGLGLGLTEAQAREIYRQGEEAVAFALLRQSKLLAQSRGAGSPPPSTVSPSNAFGHAAGVQQAKRRRSGTSVRAARTASRPWRSRRSRPMRTRDHRLDCCPHLPGGTASLPANRRRTLRISRRTSIRWSTEHVIHRELVPALPARCRAGGFPTPCRGAMLGIGVVALSAWLHYGAGPDLEPDRGSLRPPPAPEAHAAGGLVQMWRRFGETAGGLVRADSRQPTGGGVARRRDRLAGSTAGPIGCGGFSTPRETLDLIDASRGRTGLARKVLPQESPGTLICDFWGLPTRWSAPAANDAGASVARLDYVENLSHP